MSDIQRGQDSQRVVVGVDGGVAHVRLNRPAKLNALDRAMFDALVSASEGLGRDPAVRAVVLSGEGRGFCAGLDMAALAGFAERGGSGPPGGGLMSRPGGRPANHAQQAAHGWSELPVPVIAAIHGVAFGGGLQIALAADIRIVAPDARLSVMEIRWGLVPDMTGTVTLPRLVGPDVAMELTWTGREVSGEEACRLGLATRLSEDPVGDALSLAEDLAGRNPHALRAAKRLLASSGSVPLGEQLRNESAEMTALIGSPNQAEAVRAQMEARRPVFADPGLV